MNRFIQKELRAFSVPPCDYRVFCHSGVIRIIAASVPSHDTRYIGTVYCLFDRKIVIFLLRCVHTFI